MAIGVSPKAFDYIRLQSTPLVWGLPLGVIPVLQMENKGIEDFTDLRKPLPTERSLWCRYSDFCSSALTKRRIIFL